MGAAGFVTCYDLDEVLRRYAEHWPDNDFWVDLWYARRETDLTEDERKWGRSPCSVLTLPSGQRILLDYADDQGNHDGFNNPWYFGGDEEPIELPEDIRWRWDIDGTYWKGEHRKHAAPPSQVRVLTVLSACWSQTVEVWT